MIEPVQNAIDALDTSFSSLKNNSDKSEIEIVINQKAGTVRVSDNGVGMHPDQAKLSLYPGFSDKPYSPSAAKGASEDIKVLA